MFKGRDDEELSLDGFRVWVVDLDASRVDVEKLPFVMRDCAAAGPTGFEVSRDGIEILEREDCGLPSMLNLASKLADTERTLTVRRSE